MTTLPTGKPLVGRWARLDLLSEAYLNEMYPILTDPAVYAHGYVMHHRPASPDDARDLARAVFLAGQGEAAGKGGGRTAYAIQLMADGDPGPAGALVGTSSLGEVDLRSRFSLPVLVSLSRKSFLRALTGCSIANAGPASLAAELFAASQGADYIRTHDVSPLRDALTALTAAMHAMHAMHALNALNALNAGVKQRNESD